MREGKTNKDHLSGAHARNRANVLARGEWSRQKGKSNEFPRETCNGKKNRKKG